MSIYQGEGSTLGSVANIEVILCLSDHNKNSQCISFIWGIIQKISEYNLMRNNSQRRSLALSATYILLRSLGS